MYKIMVQNKQGAASGYTAETRQEINRWLKGWSDPENLSATVYDAPADGNIVAHKPYGRKTLIWAD